MKNFLIKWTVNTIALFLVIHIVAGVSADSWGSLIAAALVLGLFNAFLKPYIVIFTLPISILTFGLFTLFINAFLFYMASKFISGFEVINFWSAFWASVFYSIISSFLNFILTPKATLKFGSSFKKERDIPRQEDVIDVEGTIEDD